MLIAIGVAAGLAGGVPVVVLAALAIGIGAPKIAAPLALAGIVHGLRSQRGTASDETVFLQAVAAELRSGAGLRVALAEAAGRVPGMRLDAVARAAWAGHPISEVAGALGARLPRFGHLASAAIRVGAHTGGRLADTFDGLALIAADDVELAGERRAATADARLSAWIVGGIPFAYLVYALASGRVTALVRFGAVGWMVLTVGSALLLTGVTAIVVMVRRAEG